MAILMLSAAYLLAVEVILVVVLLFFPTKRMYWIITSNFVKKTKNFLNLWFLSYLLFLLFLLADSIMEIRKYSPLAQSSLIGNINSHSITSAKMNMFRSQRNLYISGLSLFLVVVIYRLAKLVCSMARLECSHEATLKQALNASQQFKKKLESEDAMSPEKFKKMEKELETLKKDHTAMVTQSDGLKREYDRLLDEYEKLNNPKPKDVAAEKKSS